MKVEIGVVGKSEEIEVEVFWFCWFCLLVGWLVGFLVVEVFGCWVVGFEVHLCALCDVVVLF